MEEHGKDGEGFRKLFVWLLCGQAKHQIMRRSFLILSRRKIVHVSSSSRSINSEKSRLQDSMTVCKMFDRWYESSDEIFDV